MQSDDGAPDAGAAAGRDGDGVQGLCATAAGDAVDDDAAPRVLKRRAMHERARRRACPACQEPRGVLRVGDELRLVRHYKEGRECPGSGQSPVVARSTPPKSRYGPKAILEHRLAAAALQARDEAAERRVLAALQVQRQRNSDAGWMSVDQLARAAGVPEGKVRNAVRVLKLGEWVRSRQTMTGDIKHAQHALTLKAQRRLEREQMDARRRDLAEAVAHARAQADTQRAGEEQVLLLLADSTVPVAVGAAARMLNLPHVEVEAVLQRLGGCRYVQVRAETLAGDRRYAATSEGRKRAVEIAARIVREEERRETSGTKSEET